MEPYFSIESTSSEEQTHRFTIVLYANHPIYKGHFPDVPVTPGVVLTDICRELTEKIVGQKLQLKEAKTIKFLNMVNPLETPKLHVTIDFSIVDSVVVTKIVGDFNERVYFKINANFAPSK